MTDRHIKSFVPTIRGNTIFLSTMPSLDPEKSRDDTLVSAYKIANQTTDVGKGERKLDGFGMI